jgi:hypothetical protein
MTDKSGFRGIDIALSEQVIQGEHLMVRTDFAKFMAMV